MEQERVYETESWPLGNGDVALYTENRELGIKLREYLGHGTDYRWGYKTLASQFVVPKSERAYIENWISQEFGIRIRQIADPRIIEQRITVTETHWLDDVDFETGEGLEKDFGRFSFIANIIKECVKGT
jgi:hypothetical protein